MLRSSPSPGNPSASLFAGRENCALHRISKAILGVFGIGLVSGCGVAQKLVFGGGDAVNQSFKVTSHLPSNRPADLTGDPLASADTDIEGAAASFASMGVLGKHLSGLQRVRQEIARSKSAFGLDLGTIPAFPEARVLQLARDHFRASGSQAFVSPESIFDAPAGDPLVHQALSRSVDTDLEGVLRLFDHRPLGAAEGATLYQAADSFALDASRDNLQTAASWFLSRGLSPVAPVVALQDARLTLRSGYARSLQPNSNDYWGNSFQLGITCAQLRGKASDGTELMHEWPLLVLFEDQTTSPLSVQISVSVQGNLNLRAAAGRTWIETAAPSAWLVSDRRVETLTASLGGGASDLTPGSGESYVYFRESARVFLSRFLGVQRNPTSYSQSFASYQLPANRSVIEVAGEITATGSILGPQPELSEGLANASLLQRQAEEWPGDRFFRYLRFSFLDKNGDEIGMQGNIDFGSAGIHRIDLAKPGLYSLAPLRPSIRMADARGAALCTALMRR